MRPPYSSCDSECQEVMADLGYVVSYFDLDTDGTLKTPQSPHTLLLMVTRLQPTHTCKDSERQR